MRAVIIFCCEIGILFLLFKVNYWILLKTLRIFFPNLNNVISLSFTFLPKIHVIYRAITTSTLSSYLVYINWNLQVL